MAQLGDRLRLATEARRRVGVGGKGLEDFHRGGPGQARVEGAIDSAHGALAEELVDLVSAEHRSGLDRHADGRLIRRDG